jgi:hypothetical protein
MTPHTQTLDGRMRLLKTTPSKSPGEIKSPKAPKKKKSQAKKPATVSPK